LVLFSSQYPHFSKNDFIKIEKRSGRISKNRAMDYQRNILKFKQFSKTKQLNLVNRYLNQLLPQYDAVIQNKEDYWETPKEFLITGYGDCEDYAIIKYFTLIKLGFDEKKLFLTTAFEGYRGGYHMVLSYFKTSGKPPLILDNLSFRVLDLKKRSDIRADIFINSSGVYKINRKNRLVKIAKYSSKYRELLQKIKKEN
jgi:predicted transglutaminase-like cysteine proteinase